MRRPGYLHGYDGDFGALNKNSLEDLDKKIDIYQKHIAALNKILAVGSPEGKVQASKKIAAEQAILKTLLDRRENLLQD